MSDGSSDVCSSYLLIVPEYQSVDEALRLFVDLLGLTIDDVANVRIRLGSTGGDQQGLLARRARNRTLLPHSRILAVGEDRALGPLRGAADLLARSAPPRRAPVIVRRVGTGRPRITPAFRAPIAGGEHAS